MTARFYDTLIDAFPRAKFVSITRTIDEMRAVKTPDEIRYLKKAAAMADAGMKSALKAVKPGITEIQIAGEAEYAMRNAGSEGLAFGTMVLPDPGPFWLTPMPHLGRLGKRTWSSSTLGLNIKAILRIFAGPPLQGNRRRNKKNS